LFATRRKVDNSSRQPYDSEDTHRNNRQHEQTDYDQERGHEPLACRARAKYSLDRGGRFDGHCGSISALAARKDAIDDSGDAAVLTTTVSLRTQPVNIATGGSGRIISGDG
jgi:hypothetical protein